MASNSVDGFLCISAGRNPDKSVLLLNAPPQVVEKDAARAVKRIDRLEVETVTEETLSRLLGLPGMRVIRFAIEQQGENQIDLLRRILQKKADDALSQVLKGNRWLLLKNRRELKPEEEAKLQAILDVSDELRKIYLLKEEFRTICDKVHDKAQAGRFLRAWICKAVATGSRYLIRFVGTLKNWWQEFLNYFDDGVTQGFVEGINRAIRGIINRAFGFRNFDNFYSQVLVECGGP